MNQLKRCAMALVSLGLVAACASRDTINASDVNEETFFRTFDLRYDSSSKELAMYVEARVGGETGTTVRLDADKIPAVDGKTMEVCDSKDADCTKAGGFRLDSGTFYYFKIKTDAPKESYAVTWTGQDGTKQTIQIPLAAPIERDAEMDLAWAGNPNRENESVYLMTRTSRSLGLHIADIPQEPGQAVDLARVVGTSSEEKEVEELSYSFVRELRAEPQSENGPVVGSVSSSRQSDWGTIHLKENKRR